MEPRIQYAKTEDGVSIAYWTMGEGPPLVRMQSMPGSHLQLEWQIPGLRRNFEQVARRWTLVRYDSRGFGLSDRTTMDFKVDALVGDLEAVTDRLNLNRFRLLAMGNASPVAIAYASQHPERLSHLVLWHGYPRPPSDWARTLEGLIALAEKDWQLAADAYMHTAGFGRSRGDLQGQFADLVRESATGETFASFYRQYLEWDVTDLLPSVTTPTILMQRRQYRLSSLQQAREMVAAMPDARLVLLEGSSMDFGKDGALAIDQFLGGVEESVQAPTPPVAATVHTILFTDMESSTTLADQLGDDAAQEIRRAHNEIVRSALSANSGNEIKHTGDGIMASFATASSALDCAIAIQRGVAAHKEAHPDSPLSVYVGLNAGEPIAEEDPDGRVDLFGTSINLAARICDHAQPGQILAADVVRQLAAGKQFLFADLGETELRGFEDPVKLWELRWSA